MPTKSTWSILQGKNFQFSTLPPSARHPHLMNETTAAAAGAGHAHLLAQYFYAHYARGWLYDVQSAQENQLEMVVPETTPLLVYVLKGEALLKTKPHHTASLFENSYSLWSFKPGQHALETAPGHCRILFLQLTARLRSLVDETHIGHLPDRIPEACLQLLNGLYDKTYNGEVWQLKRQVIILDLLFKTLDEIGVRYKNQQASAYHREYDTFKQIKEYVCENVHKKLSVEMLASRFSIQPTLLRRGYKKVFHHHLSDYIREVRLDRARNLLQTTQLPVHEIAWEVGYESSTSFSRVFSAHFRQSPSDFRRNTIRMQ
ncbi:AraC family transcriptional regulator [Chitinophaga lutea]|uniref:AraC family transcriptional regulator n=1 Tax=Chitinophaga lutea TaxID=2488634 RepID=A0A3N4PYX1_9BACT|nr:helix-turn-helix domain-containing protein [Chitinophaga lutea]RPE12615.1 AraC family transcriptional regulator [Chitinophaga lutea]